MKKIALLFLLLTLGLSTFAQDSNALIRMLITQNANNRSDETVVYMWPGSSNATFDSNFDAYKVQFNSSPYPTMYTQADNGTQIAINAIGVLSDKLSVGLYLWIDVVGAQTLSRTELRNVDAATSIYLEDRLTGEFIDMKENASYNFTVSTRGFHNDRFYLHFYYFQTEWVGGTWVPSAPTSTDNVRISDAYNTATNGALNVDHLQISTGGSLTVDAPNGLALTGDWLSNGTTSFAHGSTVTLNGTATQRGLVGSFGNLVINNSNGVVLNQLTSRVARALTLASGTLTTHNHLTLRSTVNGTAYVNANGGALSGEVKMERYLPSNGVDGTSYRYFGVPFTNATVADFFAPDFTINLSKAAEYNTNPASVSAANFPNLFTYNEPRVVSFASPSFSYGWYAPNTSTALPVGKGFIANISHTQTAQMSGTLQLSDVTVSNLGRNTNDNNGGWNLLGNPFATPIDLDQFLFDNSTEIDGSAYIRMATSKYGGTWQARTASGISSPSGWNGTLGIMQGFFVHAKYDLASVTFDLSNIALGTHSTSFFRKKDRQRDGLLRLKLLSANVSDETVVYFEEGATANFDDVFDAYKVQYNSNGYPTIFTKAENNMLAINGLPTSWLDTHEPLPLHLWIDQQGTQVFQVTEMSDFAEDAVVYLEDRKTGIMTNLTEVSNYTFQADKGMLEARFFLYFHRPAPAETFAETLNIYAVGKQLNVAFSSADEAVQAQIGIFSLSGQQLGQYANAEGKSTVQIPTQLPAGIYVVQVQHAHGTTAKKVFVH